MKLLLNALGKFTAGLLAMGLFLFLPAGTLHYPGGLLLCALLFVPMFFAGLILWRKAPALLEKRLHSRESEPAQKMVILLSALIFVGCFVTAGLDFRFGWTQVPSAITVAAAVLFLTAYLLYVEVLRENAYLSRTVEVQEGQQVVSTGLYGIVRHPMYAATLLLFTMMPLVLGSWAALVFLLPLPFVLAGRIRNEEQVLLQGLAGYAAYREKVRWRMIPFIW